MCGPAFEVAVFSAPVGDELMTRFSCVPFVLTGNLAAAEEASEYFSGTVSLLLTFLGHIVPRSNNSESPLAPISWRISIRLQLQLLSSCAFVVLK